MKASKRIRLIEPVLSNNGKLTPLGEKALCEIEEVLKSGWLTEGDKNREFEEKFAEYVGAKHAITVCNCTVALELALRVLGIGPGDEVIVPDFTHPATAQAVMWAGAEPVLVDVDLYTYNVDIGKLEDAITERTKCIIPVSWGGNPINMKPIRKLKEEYGLYIVEDAACSIGAEYDGEKTGSMADITCFSFHPRKIITTGEGGMITTDNDEWAEKLRSLKKFGERPVDGKLEFIACGTNFKMSNILAAVGLVQLEAIDEIIDRRIELAESYNQLLAGIEGIRPPMRDEKAKHVYQTYAVYVEIEGARDVLLKELRAQGIEVQIGTYALHLQPAFKGVKQAGNLKNSKLLYENLLTLPMSHNMTKEDQELVISNIRDILERLRG